MCDCIVLFIIDRICLFIDIAYPLSLDRIQTVLVSSQICTIT